MVVVAVPDGGVAATEDGAEKVFAAQSLPKKPIVAANAGSFGGTMVVVVSIGGGVFPLLIDFLQDCPDTINKIMAIEKKLHLKKNNFSVEIS
jgi:hypothetical protein